MFRNFQLPRFDLQPGEIQIVRGPAILRTILGSCVGVTFWHKKQDIGAMCHCILPCMPKNWPAASAISEGRRYVDFAISYVMAEFDALGVQRREIEIKLFGGSDVLSISRANQDKASIGALNCEAAWKALEEEGLSVLAFDIRGESGRKICFHTGTGDVYMQRIVTR